jgi:hypothetical protein
MTLIPPHRESAQLRPIAPEGPERFCRRSAVGCRPHVDDAQRCRRVHLVWKPPSRWISSRHACSLDGCLSVCLSLCGAPSKSYTRQKTGLVEAHHATKQSRDPLVATQPHAATEGTEERSSTGSMNDMYQSGHARQTSTWAKSQAWPSRETAAFQERNLHGHGDMALFRRRQALVQRHAVREAAPPAPHQPSSAPQCLRHDPLGFALLDPATQRGRSPLNRTSTLLKYNRSLPRRGARIP